MENNPDGYLSVLNEEQKQAVVHEGSPLLILAGAGSGKTRVITTKIAYLIKEKGVNPYSILAVTFTKKAANEMKERAVLLEEDADKSFIKTFHSFGSWFLRKYTDRIGLSPSFTVYDDDESGLLIKEVEPSLSAKEAHVVAKQIALAKDYCLLPEDDLSFLASEFDIAEIYKKYNQRLRAIGNVDFGDLILLPYLTLKNDLVVAADIHSRFKVIMVDEYQDSNIAQYKLLQELSGIKDGNDSYVCVVGDDDQSIYHFRGAEVKNILSFPDQFPGTEIIRLQKNYRSTSQILQAADSVVSHNVSRLGKTLEATRGEGKKPILAYLMDHNMEAQFCAELVSKSVAQGGTYFDWAILYRTNAQSLVFEKEFIRRKIPYKIIGSLKFYEREEIKDTLAYLSFFVNTKDIISFKRIVNKPARKVGDKTQEKIIKAAEIFNPQTNEYEYRDLLEVIKGMKDELSKQAAEGLEGFIKIFESCRDYLGLTKSEEKETDDKNGEVKEKSSSKKLDKEEKKLSDFIKKIIIDSGLEELHKAGDAIEGTQRVLNLQELVNAGVVYDCSIDGLTAFLDTINLDRELELENEKDTKEYVTLITLHNTKGLEYNKVIVTGLENGVFPREEKTGADLEEERRLFYVGITRAKDELYVTSVGQRLMYGMWKMMQPSIFLKEAEGCFDVIGKKSSASGFGFGGSYGGYGGGAYKKLSYGNPDSGSEEYSKWQKGVKVYHDDYGYGIITSAKDNGEEFVITVQFETGNSKRFLPKYQSRALTIIKD